LGPAGSLLPEKSWTQSPVPRSWPALLFAAHFAIAWPLLIGVIVRPAPVSMLLLVVVAAWHPSTPPSSGPSAAWSAHPASPPVTVADRLETEQKTVIRKKRKKPWWEE
jgi:hypothetical protein